MTEVYQNQGELRITFNLGISLVGATSIKIKYEKPSGADGEWNAGVLDADAGIAYVDMPDDNELDEHGKWRGYSKVVFASGNSAPGKPFTLLVKRQGYDN